MSREKVTGGILCVVVVILKVTLQVITPLYLDCLNPRHTQLYNISNVTVTTLAVTSDNNDARDWYDGWHGSPSKNSTIQIDGVLIQNTTTPVWQRIDPFFGIWMSMGFDTMLFGGILLFLYLCVPGQISERETRYPKSVFITSGGCQALSALLYQFSTSGKRTPPYLQGPLGYFLIPETFLLRFLILHKRPTLRKFLCAVVVLLGEFICLLPVMFPWLESETDRAEEGGATGVGRILWPMIFVLQSIPHALWNILLEKGAKDKRGVGDDMDQRRLHIVYVMFWNFFGTFITALSLFWIDFIPGFGLMPNIKLFIPQLWFNLKCIFGAVDICGAYQVFTAWTRMLTKTSMFLSIGLFVRYAEGANLYAILSAVVSPALFVVFALFDEQAVRFHPHFTFSSWLSVGSLAVMLPTVIVYNTGSAEISTSPADNNSGDASEDQEGLLDDSLTVATIENNEQQATTNSSI